MSTEPYGSEVVDAPPRAFPGARAGIAYLDADLRIVAADETLLGWCAREQAESRLRDLVRRQGETANVTPLVDCEWTLPAPDGRERRLLTRFVPVLDAQQRQQGVFAHSWELSLSAVPTPGYGVESLAGEAASAATLVAQSHATLDAARLYLADFISALGHEIRNPLAALSAALRVLEHPGATADMNLRARQTIDRKCRELTQMADTLSTLARTARADVALARAPVALAPLLRSVCADLVPHAQACGVELEDGIGAPDDAMALLDAVRCRAALRMALLGAIEAALYGNRILLALEATPTGCVVALSDTAQIIVEAFLRLRPGTGAVAAMPENLLHLGLGNLLRLVELHGAKVGLAAADGQMPAMVELRFTAA